MRVIVTALTQCPHSSSPGGPEDGSYVSGESHLTTSLSPKQLLSTEIAILSEYLTYGLRMLDVLRIVSKDGQFYLRGYVGFPHPDLYFSIILLRCLP